MFYKNLGVAGGGGVGVWLTFLVQHYWYTSVLTVNLLIWCSDGLHLTPEGNAIVYQEVIKVFNETSLSATEMPSDAPHHSKIDGQNPEKAFQLQCSAI